MSDAFRYPSGTSTGNQVGGGKEDDDVSGNVLTSAAEYERVAAQEVAPALRAPLWDELTRTRSDVRARRITPASGLARAGRLAVAASMLTEGRRAVRSVS